MKFLVAVLCFSAFLAADAQFMNTNRHPCTFLKKKKSCLKNKSCSWHKKTKCNVKKSTSSPTMAVPTVAVTASPTSLPTCSKKAGATCFANHAIARSEANSMLVRTQQKTIDSLKRTLGRMMRSSLVTADPDFVDPCVAVGFEECVAPGKTVSLASVLGRYKADGYMRRNGKMTKMTSAIVDGELGVYPLFETLGEIWEGGGETIEGGSEDYEMLLEALNPDFPFTGFQNAQDFASLSYHIRNAKVADALKGGNYMSFQRSMFCQKDMRKKSCAMRMV
jgi:hypothetical protein